MGSVNSTRHPDISAAYMSQHFLEICCLCCLQQSAAVAGAAVLDIQPPKLKWACANTHQQHNPQRTRAFGVGAAAQYRFFTWWLALWWQAACCDVCSTVSHCLGRTPPCAPCCGWPYRWPRHPAPLPSCRGHDQHFQYQPQTTAAAEAAPTAAAPPERWQS